MRTFPLPYSHAKKKPYENGILYGCFRGFEITTDRFEIAEGITLTKAYVDWFGPTMMSFSAPANPELSSPGPWKAVEDGCLNHGRVEIEIINTDYIRGLSLIATASLVAALLRLQIPSPIRLGLIANLSFGKMASNTALGITHLFEGPTQFGNFNAEQIAATGTDLKWVKDMFPVASELYKQDRFLRAFDVFEQAQWSSTIEMATILILTAMETLFDLGGMRDKTKHLCRSLSDYVGIDKSDRDEAYQVIKELCRKRGRVVHAAKSMDLQDFQQTFQLAKVAFRRVLIDATLPPSLTNI